jgi:hypothetical protein
VSYAVDVVALKAHVVNGRIIVDEPVNLPDGSEVDVYLDAAAAEAHDRDELERSLAQGIAEADRGELIDADIVLAELLAP